MEAVLVALSAVFEGAPREALRESLPLWSVVQLREGATLWKQGRPADCLAIVYVGGFDMLVDGTVVGEIRESEMIGESVLYAVDMPRFASMKARALTQVLVLSVAGVEHLRAQGSPLFEALLRFAISGAARRGAAFDRQLAQVRKGNFAEPAPPEPSGLLSRLWRRVSRPAPDPGECPPLAGLLAKEAVLAKTSPEVVAGLTQGFVARSFRTGDVIVRQGDVDPTAFVLAAGKADVLRTIEEHGGALLLGRLEPGTIFGVNAFVSGSQRTASILATSDGWVYAMTRESFDRLPAAARTAWLTVTLAVYVKQYHGAAKGLQVAIRVFATRHEELMSSQAMAGSAVMPQIETEKRRKRR